MPCFCGTGGVVAKLTALFWLKQFPLASFEHEYDDEHETNPKTCRGYWNRPPPGAGPSSSRSAPVPKSIEKMAKSSR